METSTILINGSNLDKQKLLQYIENDKKLEAIKYVKAVTRIGLKQCKDIVENLAENPNYYEGDVVDIAQSTREKPTKGKNSVRMKRPTKKGNHVIQSGTSNFKTYVAIILAMIAAGVVYFLMM